MFKGSTTTFLLLVVAGVVASANVNRITYQGRIIKPDGSPVRTNTSFRFVIKSPNSCTLWQEDQLIDLTETNGAFSAIIGGGTNSAAGSHTFLDIFDNTSVLNGLSDCTAGGTYTAAIQDSRTLYVVFDDGTGPQNLTPMPINNVPFAQFASTAASVKTLMGKPISSLASPTLDGQILEYDLATDSWVVGTAGAGVTSVALDLPSSLFAVGAPVVSSGSLTATLVNQAANSVFAGPLTGGAAAPTFRTLGTLDIPSLDASKINSGTLATAVLGNVPGANGGTVTQVNSGTGLTGGPISGAGTLSLANTAVSPGSYGSANYSTTLTVDQQGRLTAAGSTLIAISADQVTGGTINLAQIPDLDASKLVSGTLANARLPISGVTAGVFSSSSYIPSFTVDSFGRLVSVGSNAISFPALQWTNIALGVNYASGSVGIGQASPATMLDVNGAIRIANDGTACAAGLAGAIRYNAGFVEYCNGAGPGWQTLGISGSGVQSLNGLTANSQLFAVGSTGTLAAFTSAGSLHTLNIPMASTAGAAGGLVSNADYLTLMNGTIPSGRVADLDAAKITSGTFAQARLGVVGTAAGGTGLDTSLAGAGQILIGTGSGLALGTLSAGSNININNQNGTITISSSNSGGTVTQVNTGTGLAGGPFTAIGTISLADTAVTAGGYGNAAYSTTLTVDQQGRLTAAGSTLIAINGSQVTAGTLNLAQIPDLDASKLVSGTLANARLPVSGVTAGAFSSSSYIPSFTVDTFGRLVSVGSNAISFPALQWTNVALGVNYASGSVGIGQASPVTMLDVAGAIRIANDGTACAAGLAGAIRYNAGFVEYCNGSGPGWQTLGISGAGIQSLNGLTGNSQLFALGSSGTLAAFSSAGTLHTLNIPLASTAGAAGGLVSNEDYLTLMNGTIPAGRIADLDASKITSGTLGANRGGTGIDGSSAAQGQLLIGTGSGYTLGTLINGSGISIVNQAGSITISATNSGSVTQVNTGAGLVGGPISGVGTISLGTTGIAAGSVGSASYIPQIVYDIYGRITAVGSTAISVTMSALSGTLGVSQGGTGLDASSAANGSFLIGNGTGFSLGTLVSSNGAVVNTGAGSVEISTNAAVSATGNTIVMRDGSGNTTSAQATATSLRLDNAGAFVTLTNPIGANYSMVLPANMGTPGQVLSTNGTSQLNWTSVPTNGGTFLAASGSAGTPGFAFQVDTDTGLWNPGVNTLAISTAGTSRIVVNNLGNVGIGTSDPIVRLQVENNLPGTLGGQIFIKNNTMATPSVAQLGFGFYTGIPLAAVEAELVAIVPSVVDLKFKTGSGGAMYERMRIDSIGNVSMGTVSTGWGNRLEVSGGAIAAGNGGELRMMESLSAGTNSVSFRAPTSLAQNYSMTLPGTIGSPGQVLTTDGTGNLNWTSASAGATNIDGLSDGRVMDSGTAQESIFLGSSAGAANSSGDYNLGIGASALQYNTTGSSNIGIGNWALLNLNGGSSNIAIGVDAGLEMVTAVHNVGVGDYALRENTANYNTAIGSNALRYNTGGAENVAIGAYAGNGVSNNSRSRNVYVGAGAGEFATTGGNNTFVGYGAGSIGTSGSNNIAIGSGANVATGTTSNSLNIGNTIYGNLTNDRVGIGGQSPGSQLFVTNTASSTNELLNLTNVNDGAPISIRLAAHDTGSIYREAYMGFEPVTGTNRSLFAIGNTSNNLMVVRMDGKVGIGTTGFSTIGNLLEVTGGAIAAGNGGELRMMENLSQGTNFVAFKARGTLASDLTWLLPDSLGTSGQVMTVGSGGTLYWSAPSGGVTYPLLSTTLGSVATPAYSFSADSDTGLFSPGADQLAITTAGTNRIHFLADGRIGVGTSSPDSLFTVTKSMGTIGSYETTSNVRTVIETTANDSDTAIGFGSSLNLRGAFDNSSTQTASIFGSVVVEGSGNKGRPAGIFGEAISLGSTDAQVVGVHALSERNSSGSGDSIGILSIALNSNVSGTATGLSAGRFESGNSGNVTTGDGIYSAYVNNSGTTNNAFGLRTSVTSPAGTIDNAYGVYVGNVQGNQKWSFYANDSTAPSFFAGSVGIGTSTPQSLLTLGAGGETSTPRQSIQINNAGIAQPSGSNLFSDGDKLILWNELGTKTAIGVADFGLWFQNSGNTNSYIGFNTGSTSSAPSERMRIDSAGNVGIGTTAIATGARLDVVGGAIKASAKGAGAGNGGELRFGELMANGTNWISFRSPDSVLQNYTMNLPGTIGTPGQVLTTDGTGALSWTSVSGSVTYPLLSTTLGSVATPAYSFSADSDTGLWSPGANTLAISTAGTLRLVVNQLGQIGIGAAPTGNSDFEILKSNSGGPVGASIFNFATAAGSQSYLNVATGTADAKMALIQNDGPAPEGVLSSSVGNTGGLKIESIANAPIIFTTNTYQERMRITGGGSVGIGTTAPSAKFSVASSATEDAYFFFDNADVGDTTGGQSLYLYRRAAEGDSYLRFVNDEHNQSNINSSGFMFIEATGDLFLQNGASYTTHVGGNLFPRGLVGVGTQSIRAGNKMEVTGGAIAAGNGGELRMMENLSQGTNFVAFKARGTLASDLTWLLPDSLGTAGQVMTVGSGGTLYWSAPSGAVTYPLLSTTLGSVATPAYSFNGDTDTGIYSPGTNQFAITTQGTSRIHVAANGNIGIGTTNPTGRLHIIATDSAQDFELEGPTAAYISLVDNDAAADQRRRLMWSESGFMHFGKADDSWSSNVIHMSLNTDGNLGLGTSGVGSGNRLEVTGGAIAAGNGGELRMMENLSQGTNSVALRARGTLASNLTWFLPDSIGTAGNVMTVGSGGTLYWSSPSGSVTFPLLSTTMGSMGTPAYSFSGDSDTGLFSPGANTLAISTAGTTRFVVGSTGFVGIGQPTPEENLDIRGSDIGFLGAYIRNTSAGSGAQVGIEIANDTSTTGTMIAMNSTANSSSMGGANSFLINNQINGGHIVFGTNNFERVRIGTAGGVSIGTTSVRAGNRLEVTGGAIAAGNGGELRMMENLSQGTNFVAFKAHGTLGSDLTWLLPDSIGTAGNVMTVGSGGTLYWSAPSGAVTYPLLSTTLGSVATPAYSFSGDTDTGLFSPGANTLALSTGGTTRFTVDNAGNVGIGTSTPASPLFVERTVAGYNEITMSNPQTENWSVGNSFRMFGAGNREMAALEVGWPGTDTTHTGLALRSRKGNSMYNAMKTSAFGPTDYPDIEIGDSSIITSGGYSARLMVHSQTAGGDAPVPALSLVHSRDGASGASNGIGNEISFQTETSTNTHFARTATITAILDDVTDNSKDGSLRFSTLGPDALTATVAATEKMRINSAGQVGIGTTAVGTGNRLEVTGGAIAAGNGGELRMMESLSNGTNWVAFRSPTNLLQNYTMTLPGTIGTPGQVLITDGTGALSWSTVSAGASDIDSLTDGKTTGGSQSTYLGTSAGGAATTGDNNAALGYQALANTSDGDRNVALGSRALVDANGADNIGIGYQAGSGSSAATRQRNIFIGSNAGTDVSTADDNVMIGHNAGNTTTSGDSNILIGSGVLATSGTASNELNIGNVLFANLTNGYVGVGVANPSMNFVVQGNNSNTPATLLVSNAQTGTSASSVLFLSTSDAGADAFIRYQTPGTNNWYSGVDASTDSFRIGSTSGSPFPGVRDLLTVTSAGSVGIGTSTPSAKFSVAGSVTDNALFFYDNADVSDTVDGQKLSIWRRAAEGDTQMDIWINQYRDARIESNGILIMGGSQTYLAGNAVQLNPWDYVSFSTRGTTSFYQNEVGQTGIGTTAVQVGNRLEVTGGAIAAGNGGELRMMENLSQGTNFVAFKARGTLGSDLTWLLPDSIGTAGNVMTVGSGGTLYWSAPSGSVTYPLLSTTLGSMATPAYSFNGDADTGIFSFGTNNFSVSIAGSTALNINQGRTVIGNDFQTGYGGSSPELVVAESQAGSPSLMFLDYSNDSASVGIQNNYLAFAAEDTLLGFQFKGNGTFAVDYINTAPTLMSILNSGQVGIGTTAISAGARLEVTGFGTTASSMIIPRDTTANRPLTGVNGMLRYNTTANAFEGYQNGAWVHLSESVGTNTDALSNITVDFSTAKTMEATAVAGACGTLTLSGMVNGGSYTLAINNANTTCTTITHAGLTVKTPSGYTAGAAISSGIVYTFIRIGTNLWVSSVDF